MDSSDVVDGREVILGVLDLDTLEMERFKGYVNGSGRAWISRNGDLDDPVERVSYVNLGCTLHGVCAAYVLRKQLMEDRGLEKFSERVAYQR